MKIIINADDFGVSQKVNKAIYKSAIKGYVTSSTIIAVSNYLDEAVEMTKDFNKISFGIHLTFTDNFKSLESSSIFFDKNEMLNLKGLNILNTNLLVDEFSAQVEKLLNKGINLSHIDTHHHIHLYPKVLLAIIQVAKKYNIRKIRSERILTTNRLSYNFLYRYLHFKFVKAHGIIQPSFYTNFKDFLSSFPKEEDENIYEIMCHPGGYQNDESFFNDKTYMKLRDYLINYNQLDIS